MSALEEVVVVVAVDSYVVAVENCEVVDFGNAVVGTFAVLLVVVVAV